MANSVDISAIVSELYSQNVGKVAVRKEGDDGTKVDYSKLVEIGKTLSDKELEDFRNDYVTGLMSKFVADILTQKEYTGAVLSKWYTMSAEYGAIIEAITVTGIKVVPNSARTTLTSGVSTGGTFTVYLPTISADILTREESWSVPITLQGSRMNTAFSSASELEAFTNMIFTVVRNAITIHLADMDASNRNNFILERFKNHNKKGIYNLCEMYYKETGDDAVLDSGVVKAVLCMRTPRFWLFVTEQARLMKSYMGRMSALFTLETERFVAPDDMVIECLSIINEKCNTYAMSDTYHNELVAMPSGVFDDVAGWQGIGTSFDDFDNCSKITGYINVGGVQTEATIEGVAMIFADKRACMHTIKSRRTPVMRDEFKDLTAYEYQFVDSYANLLDMPFAVFQIVDWTTV